MADSLANTHGRVREWIGPRIIPVFADEVQWDDESTYEPLMMVQNQGETFMSRQYVPAGAPLPDVEHAEESNDYWVHMSNWNAQVEGYREEVIRYAAEVLLFDGRIDALEDALPISEFDSTNTVDARFDTIEADSWVTAIRIAADAVTTAKIADANVTNAKIAADAVTTAKIADGNVTTAKIADGNVTTAKIADSNVSYAKLSDSAKESIRDYSNEEQLLLIGDSWLNPEVTTRHLREYIASKLNISTVYNVAEGGTGFLRVFGNNFLAQAQSLCNNSAIDKSKKTKCVILGGTNDYDASFTNASDYVNAINTIVDTLKATFTNIEIQVFFMQWKKGRAYSRSFYDSVITSVTKCKVNNGGYPVSFADYADNLHLTDTGDKRYADYVAACFGIGKFSITPVEFSIKDRLNAIQSGLVTSSANIRVSWDEKEYNVFAYIGFSTTATAGTLNTFLSNIDWPIPSYGGGYATFRIHALGQSSYINIAPDVGSNRLGIRNFESISDTAYSGSVTYVSA